MKLSISSPRDNLPSFFTEKRDGSWKCCDKHWGYPPSQVKSSQFKSSQIKSSLVKSPSRKTVDSVSDDNVNDSVNDSVDDSIDDSADSYGDSGGNGGGDDKDDDWSDRSIAVITSMTTETKKRDREGARGTWSARRYEEQPSGPRPHKYNVDEDVRSRRAPSPASATVGRSRRRTRHRGIARALGAAGHATLLALRDGVERTPDVYVKCR